MIHLRNGTQVPKSVANDVYGKLLFLNGDLEGQEPDPEVTPYRLVVFAEFAMFCRNPQHKLVDTIVQMLKEGELLEQDGSLREEVKNVVLSAITGENQLEFALVPPAVHPIAA